MADRRDSHAPGHLYFNDDLWNGSGLCINLWFIYFQSALAQYSDKLDQYIEW